MMETWVLIQTVKEFISRILLNSRHFLTKFKRYLVIIWNDASTSFGFPGMTDHVKMLNHAIVSQLQ